MAEKSASEQIDDIIKLYGGWKGKIIADIRAVVRAADPDIVEEVKWRMKSRPEGLPVWSHNGIVCLIETLKNDTKLVFFKGKFFKDSNKLFNARLKSSSVRAIEYHEGDTIDANGIKTLVHEGILINTRR